MYQKTDLQQLQNHSLDKIKSYKEKAVAHKTELETLKSEDGKAWTSELQEELDDIVLFLVDVDELIDEKTASSTVAGVNSGYVVKPGTEKMVHLSLVRGRRFNPNTGKEESKAFTQLFTFSEWQLFKNNFKGLGYTIMAVLHDPYGEAKEFVITDK